MGLTVDELRAESAFSINGKLIPAWKLIGLSLITVPVVTSSATYVTFGQYVGVPPSYWSGQTSYQVKLVVDAFRTGGTDGTVAMSLNGTTAIASSPITVTATTRTISVSAEFTVTADDVLIPVFHGDGTSSISIEGISLLLQAPQS